MLHILELRKKAKLTQGELGRKLDVGQQAVSQYEIGKREPDLETLCKIADFFEVSADYLLGRVNEDNIKVEYRKIPLPKDEQELLDYYRSCTPTAKKYILSKAMICSIEGVPELEQKSSSSEADEDSDEGKLLA